MTGALPLRTAGTPLSTIRHTTRSNGTGLNACSRFLLVTDGIADPAHGVYEFPGKRVIHLGAQMSHIDINNIGQPFETLVPDMFNDHGAREHPSRAGGEIFEERIFLRGQVDSFPGPFDLLREPVQFEVAHAQDIRPDTL